MLQYINTKDAKFSPVSARAFSLSISKRSSNINCLVMSPSKSPPKLLTVCSTSALLFLPSSRSILADSTGSCAASYIRGLKKLNILKFFNTLPTVCIQKKYFLIFYRCTKTYFGANTFFELKPSKKVMRLECTQIFVYIFTEARKKYFRDNVKSFKHNWRDFTVILETFKFFNKFSSTLDQKIGFERN